MLTLTFRTPNRPLHFEERRTSLSGLAQPLHFKLADIPNKHFALFDAVGFRLLWFKMPKLNKEEAGLPSKSERQ